jgi:RNA polymerase sigma factor for flagellar operon FliA
MQLSPQILKNAWEDFSVYRKPLARAELIQHYAYLVKVTVGRLVVSLPGGVEREDLVSAGVVGLIKAVDHFDFTRDVKFETYAIALIRGAVLEMLREEDWVPRSIREKLRALDRATMALEAELGHAPTEQQIAERMGVPAQQVSELIVRTSRTMVHSLEEVIGSSSEEGLKLVDLLVDEENNTDKEIQGREIRRILVQGTEGLPEREKLVVALYYHRGLTFREIGKVLGVSEPRAHHLHTQAMTRLRTHMQHQGITQPC